MIWEKNYIADYSQKLIEENIDFATRVGAFYLNVHPGAHKLKKLDLNQKMMTIADESVVTNFQARESLAKRSKQLVKFAKEHNVLLLFETLPRYDLGHWRIPDGRNTVRFTENILAEELLPLMKIGVQITNDFGHTIANWVSADRYFLWKKFDEFFEKSLDGLGLIHLNPVIAPFNGTDSHTGLSEKDFLQNPLPSRDQIIEVLSEFPEIKMYISSVNVQMRKSQIIMQFAISSIQSIKSERGQNTNKSSIIYK